MADATVTRIVDKMYPEEPMPGEPKVIWGPAEVGKLFGVDSHTVQVWTKRYGPQRTAAQIAKAPTMPQPIFQYGIEQPKMGWDPEQEAELRAWRASLPGQGAGGGRKPRNVA